MVPTSIIVRVPAPKHAPKTSEGWTAGRDTRSRRGVNGDQTLSSTERVLMKLAKLNVLVDKTIPRDIQNPPAFATHRDVQRIFKNILLCYSR